MEVRFPVILKDVRYSLPVITGEVWTSGFVVARLEGIYLISEEDGLYPKETATRSITPHGHLARHSVFLSKESIVRIAQGEKLIGVYLEARGGKVRLGLSTDGWEELDVIRQAMGISG